MTVYRKVPMIGTIMNCDGCVAHNELGMPKSPGMKALCDRLYSESNACEDIIWIEDTDEAKAKYIAMRLTS